MTLRALVASRLATIPAILGEAVAWRVRTSAPGVAPVTWSAWTPAVGQVTGDTEVREPLPNGRGERHAQRAELLVPDTVVLPIGSEVRTGSGPSTRVWTVGARSDAAPGLAAYPLARDIPRTIAPPRGGRTA